MGKYLLILTAISAGMYLVLSAVGAVRRISKNRSAGEFRRTPAYFWGLLFTVFFYYGFPVWWWRYGLRGAVTITITCIAVVAGVQLVLRVAGIIEVDGFIDSIVKGLFIAVPVRAVAGVWIANNDCGLREAILLKRGSPPAHQHLA